jgi:hypothetical protein
MGPRVSPSGRWYELQATSSGEPAIAFGPFRLIAGWRLLVEGDKPERLGSPEPLGVTGERMHRSDRPTARSRRPRWPPPKRRLGQPDPSPDEVIA